MENINVYDNIYLFNNYCDCIIHTLNSEIRKEFINYYSENPKIYKKQFELYISGDFYELSNEKDKCNLKSYIYIFLKDIENNLEMKEDSNTNKKIITLAIIIYYYFSRNLEHTFSFNIFNMLKLNKKNIKKIKNIIMIISSRETKIYSLLRRFCNEMPMKINIKT